MAITWFDDPLSGGLESAEIVEGQDLNWLGGRDSNPDTVVQSHVSYRWTTSQYQSGAPEGQQTPIIAYAPQAPATGRAPTRHWDVLTASRCRNPRRNVRRHRSRCPRRLA